jgi:lysophospholipase L1-like esterase
LVWATLLAVCAAVAVEAGLALRARRDTAPEPSGRTRYDRLHAAYLPFAIQHLHPVYLFFFPFDPAQRAALSSPVVHLDREGFRGGGPEHARGRRLGFLLGGSTAFGHFASSDATTISGQLNELQSERFVVNAGVPSWSSTQELMRLAHQILAYQPELIVSLGGANDMEIVVEHHAMGIEPYPGAPESFHRLQALVDDVRGQPAVATVPPWERLLPRLTGLVRRRHAPERQWQGPPIPEPRLRAAAHRYVANLAVMRDLAGSRGARFVPIFQPILWLHQHAGDPGPGGAYAADYRAYHRLAFVEAARVGVALVDFSGLFDAHFERVPSFDRQGARDLTDADIFLDAVHLSDAGNRIVAEEIVAVLGGP